MSELPPEHELGRNADQPLSAVLGRQSALTLSALVVNGVARVVSSLIVGRLAGPVSLGVFQAGVTGAQLAALFGPAALGSAASSFVARAKADGDRGVLRAVEAHLLLRVLQSSVLVVMGASLVWLVASDGTQFSTLAFATLTASFCLYAFSRGLLYGSGRTNRAARWNIVTSLLSIVLVGLGVGLGAHDSALLALFSLSYFTFSVVNWTSIRPRRLSGSLGREIDRFTRFAVLGTLASAGFLDGTMVLAAVVGTPNEAGQFGAAFVLAIPATLIGATATVVLFPLLSGLHHADSRSSRNRLLDLASRCLAVVVVPLFATLILLRREFVEILWGPEFSSAAALLAPLLLALLMTTLAIPAVNALTASSRRGVRVAALSSLAGLATGALTWLLLVPQFGTTGVAYGFLCGCVISSVVPFVLAWRESSQTWLRHSLQLTAAVSMLAGLSYAQATLEVGTLVNIATWGVFVTAWLVLVHSDVRIVLTVVRNSVRKS